MKNWRSPSDANQILNAKQGCCHGWFSIPESSYFESGEWIVPSESHGIDTAVSRWPTYQPMVLVVAAFAGGVYLDRVLSIGWQVSLPLACVSLIGWLWLYRAVGRIDSSAARSKGRARFVAVASTLLLIGLVCAGAFWHHGRWNWFGETELGRFATDGAQPCLLYTSPSPRDRG